MESTTPLPFDERSSTVNAALALWTALAAGGIVSLGGFDAPAPVDNAYVRLATLAATAVLLGLAFAVRSERTARRLQLGVVLSLIAHTFLVGGLAFANLSLVQPLASIDEPPVKEPEEEQPPELVLVDRIKTDQVADFERPVETGAPQMQDQQLSPEREAPKAIDSMAQPADAPEFVDPAPDAPLLTRPRAAVAVADIELGERSRNLAAAARIAPQAIEVEQQAPPVEQTPDQPTPQPGQAASRAAPQVVAPAARVEAPRMASAPAPTIQPRRADASSSPARPTLRPSSQPSSRPRTLARIGPAPLESLAPLPSASVSPTPTTPATGLAPSATPLADASRRSAPSVSIRPPTSLAPLAPLAPEATAALPRPDRLAMRGDGPAPQIAPLARSRGRSAPLAALGSSGTALAAPAALNAGGESSPGRSAMLDAPPGAGGLGSKPSTSAGVERLATNRDASANLNPGRFRNAPSGGTPSVSGDARAPAAAFSSRGDRRKQLESGSAGSPSPRTEAAIELGLEFLARVQRDDGSWAFDSLAGARVEKAEVAQAKADAAATGLALLSFLGAGYDHTEGRHQNTVRRGIEYLKQVQTPDGLLFAEHAEDTPWQVARFYSHGIASIALCEAYGMTGDDKLRGPAQRALDYIEKTQVTSRGGWRYTPGVNSDLSVTGWMLMALRSGDLAGLEVSSRIYAGVRMFLESCREQAGQQARFRYNPEAPADDPRTSHGRNPGTVMTSVGLLMQLYLGEGRESQRMQRGADHLLENLPTIGDSLQPAQTSTLENPLRDTYYWYYGTQVMFHMGGNHWSAWNDALHPLLVDTQTRRGPLAGSWNPVRPVPDKWRHLGGRLYVTTLNLLSLEVYYRHLPLYEMTGR